MTNCATGVQASLIGAPGGPETARRRARIADFFAADGPMTLLWIVLFTLLGGAASASAAGALLLVPDRLPERLQIGRAHVCTPVTNAHLVCRLLLENTKH